MIAHDRSKKPVTAADLGAEGALAVLLKNALAPNLVQTLEHAPVFVHGGPFANIAHGCNSVIATRTALKLADIVVTEAGFGSDLGAEKFIDIKCRKSGLRPDAVVVVATVRALKFHGGVAVPDLQKEDVEALRRGFVNIERHLTNLRDVFGLPAVVAINRFPTDTDAEIQVLRDLTQASASRRTPPTHFADGGAGAEALAWGVLDELKQGAPNFRFAYPDEGTVEEKATAVATKLYGAAGVNFAAKARKQLAQIAADGFAHLPVCVAKTQYSFTTNPKAVGAPSRPHHRRPRGPALRRRRLHRPGHRRHHDHARPARRSRPPSTSTSTTPGWSPACRRALGRMSALVTRRTYAQFPAPGIAGTCWTGGHRHAQRARDSVGGPQPRSSPPCPSCCASRCPTSRVAGPRRDARSARPAVTSRPSRSSRSSHDGTAVDDVLLEMAPGAMPDSVVSACNQLDGVEVLWISRYAAGGNLFLDLEVVEELTANPGSALDTLVGLLPVTFRVDWAARLAAPTTAARSRWRPAPRPAQSRGPSSGPPSGSPRPVTG